MHHPRGVGGAAKMAKTLRSRGCGGGGRTIAGNPARIDSRPTRPRGAWSSWPEPGARSLELVPGARSLELVPGAWSLELVAGARSVEPGAWSLELVAGARSLEPELVAGGGGQSCEMPGIVRSKNPGPRAPGVRARTSGGSSSGPSSPPRKNGRARGALRRPFPRCR